MSKALQRSQASRNQFEEGGEPANGARRSTEGRDVKSLRGSTSGSWTLTQVQTMIDQDERLRRVSQYVRAHIADPILLEDAAGVAALSRTYFSAYFRLHTGVGFRRWVQRLRVQRAQALMGSATLTLAEIGHRAGFRDSRTFQRTFKRHRGDCPSANRGLYRG